MEEKNKESNISTTDKKNHSKRAPYADLGLMTAISILIVMLVKSFLFGFTWGAIAGLAVTAAYLIISAVYRSESNIVRHATTAYLILSALSICSVIMFDKNTRPKMVAFKGVDTDTVKVEETKIEEEVPIAVADTAVRDTIAESAMSDSTAATSQHNRHEVGIEELMSSEPSDTTRQRQ